MNTNEMKLAIMSSENEDDIKAAYDAFMRSNNSKIKSGFDDAPKTIKIKKGLSIFKNHNTWWFRVSLPGFGSSGVRKGTGTQNISDAKMIASVESTKVRMEFDAGLLTATSSSKWEKICEQFIFDCDIEINEAKARGKKRTQAADYKSKVNIYIIDNKSFSGKSIKAIGYSELLDFSRSKEIASLKKSTVNFVKMTLKRVFEKGLQLKLIDNIPEFPTFTFAESDHSMPFTDSDRSIILNPSNLKSFLEDSTKYDTYYLRTQFPHYINFLDQTGMRPGQEVYNLDWSDVKEGEFVLNGKVKKTVYIEVKYGKTSFEVKDRKSRTTVRKSREVIAFPGAVDALEAIYEYQTGQKSSIKEIIKMQKKGLIFIGIKGKEPNFYDTFKQYMSFVDNKITGYYTPYALRHEFINNQLDKGYDILDIAEHCGNSAKTIQDYYRMYKSMNKAGRLLSVEDIKYFDSKLMNKKAPPENISEA